MTCSSSAWKRPLERAWSKGVKVPVGYKYSIRRTHRASNHTAQSNRCQRATIGGVQRPEGKPPADRTRNAGATQQICRGQARRQDEGEQGSVRGRPPPGGGRRATSIRTGLCGLGSQSSSQAGSGRSPVGSRPAGAVGRGTGRAGAVLLHPAPQAQGPTRAEPDPPGRRRGSRWGGTPGLGLAGTPSTWVRSAGAPAPGRPGSTVAIVVAETVIPSLRSSPLIRR
jgi:hypothetical protein